MRYVFDPWTKISACLITNTVSECLLFTCIPEYTPNSVSNHYVSDYPHKTLMLSLFSPYRARKRNTILVSKAPKESLRVPGTSNEVRWLRIVAISYLGFRVQAKLISGRVYENYRYLRPWGNVEEYISPTESRITSVTICGSICPKGPYTQIVYTLGLIIPIWLGTLAPKHILFGYTDDPKP